MANHGPEVLRYLAPMTIPYAFSAYAYRHGAFGNFSVFGALFDMLY